MLKKILSVVLITSVLGIEAFAVTTTNISGDDDKQVEKVRQDIRKLGTGPDARIKLKLVDNSEVEGYISEANDKDFTVVNSNNSSTVVPYPQVRTAKGNNLSGGAKIAITIAVVAALTFLSHKFGRRRYRRF